MLPTFTFVVDATNKATEVFKQIEQYGAESQKRLSVGFDAVVKNSQTIQLGIQATQSVLAKMMPTISSIGDRLTQQFGKAEVAATRFANTAKGKLAQVAEGFQKQMNAATASVTSKLTEGLDKAKSAVAGNSLFQKIAGNSLVQAVGADAKALAGRLPGVAQGFASRIPGGIGMAANMAGRLGSVAGVLGNLSLPGGKKGGDDDKKEGLFGQVTGVIPKLAAVGQAFGGIGMAIGMAKQAASTFYGKLIQSNVELQQQLLSTKATLVSTNRVFQAGVEVKDPTAAIKALDQPVQQAIKRIREGSLELSGVTSSQLIPIFQNIAGQSAAIGANLDQSADLTLSFAAALGTLSIPLDQQRQEVSSILQANITSDSTLAKSLNITNEQVKNWKAQKTLVTELTSRLEAFRAGNKLAANTIEGVTSNIQELFDIIFMKAGEPFLEPIVKQINQVYEFLKSNEEGITNYIRDVARALFDIGQTTTDSVKGIIDFVGLENITAIGNGLKGVLELTSEGLKGAKILIEEIAKSPIFEKIQKFLDRVGEGWEKIGELPQSVGEVTGATEETAAALEAATMEQNRLSDANLGFQKRLLALQEIEAAGNPLTKEQRAEKTKLTEQVRIQNLSIDDQISRLKGLQKEAYTTPAQRSQITSMINELDKLKVTISQTTLAANKTPEKGTVWAQLKQQADDYVKTLEKGEGSAESYEAAAKGVLSTTQQLLDQKMITPEDAVKQLELVANNTKLSTETQLSARKELIKQLDALDDSRQEEIKAKLSEINTQQMKGQITGVEAAQKSGKLKQEALDLELATAKKVRDEKVKLIQQELELTVKAIEVKIEALKAEAAATSDPKRKAELDKQIQALEGAKVSAKNSANKLAESADKDLANKQKTIQEQKAQAQIETEKKITDETLKEIDKRSADVKSKYDKERVERESRQLKDIESGRLTEGKAAKENLESKQKENDEIIALEREKIEKLKALPKASSPEEQKRREDEIRKAEQTIANMQLDLEKARIETSKKLFADEVQALEKAEKKKTDAIEIAELERKIAQQERYKSGQVSKSQMEIEDAQVAVKQAEKEISNEQEKLRKIQAIQAGDKESRERKEQMEAESRKKILQLTLSLSEKQIAADKAAADALIKEFEDAQNKAKEVFKEAQLDRELANRMRLRNGLIDQEEFDKEVKDLELKSMQEELDLEEEKLKALEALPKPNDPDAVEERESQIRASRTRTKELTLQLLKTEGDAQKELFDNLKAKAQNYWDAQKLQGEIATMVIDESTKALDNQLKLLEARQSITKSYLSMQQQLYGIAKDLLGAEEDEELQRQLELEAAQANLAGLREQQLLERESLELNHQKTMLLLEQEKIKNRQRQTDAEANLADAKANYQMLKAQGVPQDQLDAAALKIQSAQLGVESARSEGVGLEQREKIEELGYQNEKRQMESRQSTEDLEARARIAKATEDDSDNIALGYEARNRARSAGQQAQAEFRGDAGTISAEANSLMPELQRVAGEGFGAIGGQLLETSKAQEQLLGQIRDSLEKSLAKAGQQINNYFPPGTTQDGAKQFLNEFKKVIDLAKG